MMENTYDLPNEAIEELERRAGDMGLSLDAYIHLLLISAAVRQEKGAVKEWAMARGLFPATKDK